MDAFVGEIRMFAGAFAPIDWAFCDGSLYPISYSETLYALIGNTFGGDGVTTFAVPDLRGRVPIHRGVGAGLSPRTVGQTGGVETVALNSTNVPTHSHTLTGSLNPATTGQPGGNLLAKAASFPLYTSTGPVAALSSAAIGTSSGPPQAHNNVQPFLCVAFIICMNGYFPQRG